MNSGGIRGVPTSGVAPGLRPTAPPGGRRIAVIAPHPDDEVLGCGGTLRQARENDPRTEIRVLYLTDGERGSSDASMPLDEVARLRREEARKGLAVLGCAPGAHAAFADGRLAVGPGEVRRVVDFLRECEPEIVMTPAPLDPHRDHRAATAILAQALLVPGAPQPAIWVYEVQPCLPMNALVRIDAVEGVKARALAEHLSQNPERLMRAAAGLAACRALYAPPGWQSAEAFRIGSAALFLRLCRSPGAC